MIIRSIKKLFSAPCRTDDGTPVWLEWVVDADGEKAVLVNTSSGVMVAHVLHDGCGKFYRRVVVSPWRALRLILNNHGYLVSLCSFPRMTVELAWLKHWDIRLAQRSIEALFDEIAG